MKPVVTRLISDKINFKAKSITRDKDRHFIKIKGSLHQEDIIIINAYIK